MPELPEVLTYLETLAPRIVGESVGLHPVWLIFALVLLRDLLHRPPLRRWVRRALGDQACLREGDCPAGQRLLHLRAGPRHHVRP